MEHTLHPGPISIFDEMEQNKPILHASTGQRFVNYIIDFAVLYAAAMLFGLLLALIQSVTGSEFLYDFLMDEGDVSKLWEYVFGAIIFLITYTFIEGITKGRSLGKLITGTRAVREDGSKINWSDAFKRTACRLIPFEPLSALTSTPWHDRLTKTTVIKIR